MKNYNIKKTITFIIPLLSLSCTTKNPVVDNSVFTTPVKTNIFLEKPYINKSWTTTGGNKENMIDMLAEKRHITNYHQMILDILLKQKKIIYSPVANETTVFTIDGNLKIIATDINTGNTLWKIKDIKNNDLIKYGALALSDGFLYAATNNSQILKINPVNGEILYSKYLNTNLRSGLQICNNKLFFISNNNELYIIDANTGDKLYTHKTMEETSSFIKGSTPACVNDKIITTFSNGEVHALSISELKPLWLSSVYKINNANINNISDVVANPIIKNDYVIIKGYNDITKSININTGNTIWHNSNGGLFSGVISNNTMFDINNNNVISATNTIDGKIEWETKLETQKGELIFSPLLINNQLVIPISNGSLIKINPYDGKILETQELTSKIDVSPIIINDKLIIISNGNLKIFN